MGSFSLAGDRDAPLTILVLLRYLVVMKATGSRGGTTLELLLGPSVGELVFSAGMPNLLVDLSVGRPEVFNCLAISAVRWALFHWAGFGPSSKPRQRLEWLVRLLR